MGLVWSCSPLIASEGTANCGHWLLPTELFIQHHSHRCIMRPVLTCLPSTAFLWVFAWNLFCLGLTPSETLKRLKVTRVRKLFTETPHLFCPPQPIAEQNFTPERSPPASLSFSLPSGNKTFLVSFFWKIPSLPHKPACLLVGVYLLFLTFKL